MESTVDREKVLLVVVRGIKYRWALLHMKRKAHDALFPDGCNVLGCPDCKSFRIEEERLKTEWNEIQNL